MEVKCGKIDRCRNSSDCPHDFRPSGAICRDYDNKRVFRKDYNKKSRKREQIEIKNNDSSSDKPDCFDYIDTSDISHELRLLYAVSLFGSYEAYVAARNRLINLYRDVLNTTDDE